MSAVQQQIDELLHHATAARHALVRYIAAVCPGGEQHGPIQHRDGRPPWCPYCRRTNTGQPIK